MAASNANIWKLLTTISKEAKESDRQVKLVRVGQRTRIQNKKYTKLEKAIKSAYTSFEASKDLKQLLRFASHQSDNIGIGPIEMDDEEYPDSD